MLYFSDTLSCSSCLKKQETRSLFLNISLELDHFCSTGVSRGNDSVDLPPVRNTAPKHLDLKNLLELHMQTEILDISTGWECLDCSSNVQGVKYHESTSLPPNLMIHLQRLKYNSVSR